MESGDWATVWRSKPSPRSCSDAKRILRWADEHLLDHATKFTLTGFNILIFLAGIDSSCPSKAFYGRLPDAEGGDYVSITEHEMIDGRDDGSDETFG